MSFYEQIIGNDQVKCYLTRMIEKKAIANSLLFAGPDGIGKSLFAEAFAKQLLCMDDPKGNHRRKIEAGTHPDIRVYHPEGKIGMHSIDSMRQFSEEVYQAPYEAMWKVFIIHDADRMLTYSANALLKTFEEPAQQSIIILLSSLPESLLPTILSRCRTIRFHTVAEQEIAALVQAKCNKSTEEAQAIAGLAQGSVGSACRLAEQGGDPLREQILKILAKGKMSTYSELIKVVAEISEGIEQGKQQIEEIIRTSMTQAYPDGVNSAQQHAIDKEVDGAVAMRLARDAHAILDLILTWYRDMHLLLVGGNSAYLLHRDFKEEIDQSLQRGAILPMATVQKAIAQAQLALARSTPLSFCLENLFLQLGYI